MLKSPFRPRQSAGALALLTLLQGCHKGTLPITQLPGSAEEFGMVLIILGLLALTSMFVRMSKD